MNKVLLLLAFCGCSGALSAQCLQLLSSCSPPADTICGFSNNNPLLWNEFQWFDPLMGSHDLSEASVDLQFSASDACGSAPTISYLLKLDLDADGQFETALNSNSLPASNTLLYNNLNGPGELRAFDERPVPLASKYRFGLKTTVSGNTTKAFLIWTTDAAPNFPELPLLPYGRHQISWFVTGSDGSKDTCTQVFSIRDCKKPTVVTLNGLSVNIMPTGMITLWSSDFLQYTEDNATPTNLLQIAVVKSAESNGTFPVDGNGNPIPSVSFTCTELGTQPVQLWSRDLHGNAEYAETYVIVQDNMGNCTNDPFGVRVCCEAESGDGIANVAVNLQGYLPALPPISFFPNSTDSTGCVDFPDAIPFAGNYYITPGLDDNPLNGVTTFDILLISKHILGVQPLGSPYQMIAADINKSGSITSYDIVQLQKLVLGIYTELPANTSWRFVPKSFVFPNPGNPFQTAFPESITVADAQTSFNWDFVGIKIGDVNGSAKAHFRDETAEDRSTAYLELPDIRLAAGETREISLTPAEAAAWQGLQFAMAFDPKQMAVEQVVSEALPGFSADCCAQPKPGELRLSWANAAAHTALLPDEALITLRVTARQALRLRDILRLDPTHLEPEAYAGNGSRQALALRFREEKSLEQLNGALTVFPARPNPTREGAALAFRLNAAETVRFTLFNISGERVWEETRAYPAGAYWAELPASAFPEAGLYLWRAQAGTAVQTGKIVRL